MATVELTGGELEVCGEPFTYECEIHPMGMFGSFDDFEEVKAVYMFARVTTNPQTRKSTFRAVYIGETEDVKKRLRTGHHRIADIRRKRATHIFIYRDEEDPLLDEAETRRLIEDDLMHYRPLCQPEKWPQPPN